MRTSIIQVVLTSLLVCSGAVYGADLSEYEKTCLDLGFKKRTPAYGECVLELDKRSTDQQKQVERARIDHQRQQQDQERIARGDGSADHQTCYKYGFVPGSTSYAECRQKIDMARRDMAQKQAAYELQLRQYEAEKQRYEAEKQDYEERVAAAKKERERQAWLNASQFFFGMAAGNSPSAATNFANAGRAPLGGPPVAPTAPQLQNYVVTMPGGNTLSCNSGLGNTINCSPLRINMPRGPNY